MADSISLQILKAMETRLKKASVLINGLPKTPPTGLVVQRERILAIMPKHVEDGPLIVINEAGEKPTVRDHHKSPKTDRVLQASITIAADAELVPNSDALDPASNWITHALQSEPTLGYLAHWIMEEGREDFSTVYDESSKIVAIRELKLEIGFHTRTDDPTARS
jgi:hypothetical protein